MIAGRSSRADEIVGAAGELLEREGPEALTMRRLGEALGIRAPSLYKHFPNKAAVESALIDAGLLDIGEVCHAVVRRAPASSAISRLLRAYRAWGLAHPNLYRLATAGRLDRAALTPGREEWAGTPFFVAAGDDPHLARALWAFAHGTLILELDDRYADSSGLDRTWAAGAEAFTAAVTDVGPGGAASMPVAERTPRMSTSSGRPRTSETAQPPVDSVATMTSMNSSRGRP